MTDPIITAEELLKDCGLSPLAWRVDLVKRALAQARAEGRLAGMEEAARPADGFSPLTPGTALAILQRQIANFIRARTTKEG